MLDCSQVTFIDSTGLGLLIGGFRRCKEAGGMLLLVSPSSEVVKILATLRLDRLIPAVRTPEEIREFIASNASGSVDFTAAQDEAKSLRVAPSGDITAATAEECERMIVARWSGMPESLVLNLDLACVSFVDSSGLGLLIKTYKLAKQRPGAALKLTNLQPNVRNVIRLANMEAVLGLESQG